MFRVTTQGSGVYFMGSADQVVDIFKCPLCNGNVRIGPDDVVITCTYCGGTSTIEGKAMPAHLMERGQDADERLRGFQSFLEKNKGMNRSLVRDAKVIENTLLYVPVWTSKVKADTWYKGYKTVQVPVQKTRTYRDSNGHMRTRTVTEYEPGYVPVQDEIHTDTMEPLLARKGARLYGLEEFLQTVDVNKAEPYDFGKIKDLTPVVLNAEIGQEEFEKTVAGRVADRHRQQAKSKLTELFDCSTKTSIRDVTYLQVPFGFIRYKFGGDLYKCAIDGNSGKVVRGEIPITKAQRLLWTFLGLIGVFVAGVGAEFAYWGMLGDITELIIGGIVAAIVGIVMSVSGFRVLLMTQREKKG